MSLGGELLLASFGPAFEPLQSSIFKESLHDEELYTKSSQTMIATEHELKVNSTETWKNFPFPPTPPTSPISSPYPMDTNEERFQPVCGEFEDESFFADEECIPEDDNKLKSMLIKDCMWNGASPDSTEKRRRFSRLERIRLLCQTPPLVECTARIVSVDPSEVFPYPLNGCAQTDDGEEKEIVERDDESEEEVEVDVVTIENGSIKQEGKQANEGDTKKLEESAETSEPLKEVTENIMKENELEIKEELEDEDDEFSDSVRSLRRVRKLSSPPESPSKPKKVKYSSSGESNDESEENDSEYARATHNVLERKRRNDLKLRFQRLRDSVPELKGNDRAPKVAILRKSWEFIKHLKDEERKLVSETERQKRINALLLKRLLMLNQEKQ